MKNQVTIVAVLLLTSFFLTSTSWAQTPRQSPPAIASGTVNEGKISIDYSSPAVRGRKIWGELVPYDKVWRAGANEATLITFEKAVTVEGKPLPAGKYSLYAIPGENEWVIIINSITGQWGIKPDGTTTEDPAKDVLRATVKPVACPEFNERLIYMIESNGFSLFWENLRVPVSVK